MGGPGAGMQSVPPPSVPLSFLAAAGVGLVAFGSCVTLAADTLVTGPTRDHALATVHVGMLAFLTVAVLGAAHQFAPVVAHRPLRSVTAARLTLVGILVTAWTLPTAFALDLAWLVAAAGSLGWVTVMLAAWNLSGPLSERGGGVPLIGLRLSITYLVAVVSLGVLYALAHDAGWFPLLPERVMAHAHLGLGGWLGLTYVAVAEKLWPMFLLAHRPTARAGAWAVGLLAGGVGLLVTGLLADSGPMATAGGVLAAGGIAAHLVSLATAIRHRRRKLELLHAWLLASAAFAVAAVVLGALAGLADVEPVTRMRLVSAEIAALVGWLGLAVVGHAHKIVPFIAYTALRARGVRTGPGGRPLLFGDLFDPRLAHACLVGATAGFALAVGALVAGTAPPLAAGGLLLAATGAVATANLVRGPVQAAATAVPSAVLTQAPPTQAGAAEEHRP